MATGSALLVNMLIGFIGTLQDGNFPSFLHVCGGLTTESDGKHVSATSPLMVG